MSRKFAPTNTLTTQYAPPNVLSQSVQETKLATVDRWLNELNTYRLISKQLALSELLDKQFK